MMIKSTRAVLSAGLLLLASGCSSVTVREPIGEVLPPTELKALEGVWSNEDGPSVPVRRTESGNLVAGGLEWDEEKQEFRAETVQLPATKIRELRLLFFADDEEADGAYLFCRYEMQDADTARLYMPIQSLFERAVESGELSGTITRQPMPWNKSVDVRIDATGEQVDAFLKKSGDAACFEKEPFGTFKRLGRSE